MKDQIPQFLLEKFETNRPHVPKFPDEYITFILNYANFYEWNIKDIKFIFNLMRKGYSIKPICELEGCYCYKQPNKKLQDFSLGCCVNHSQQISNMKKYNVTNPSKLESVTKKREHTNLEKYGSKNVMGNKTINEKFNAAIKNKYGSTHYFQSNDFKTKNEETLTSKYGIDNVMKVPEIRQKAKQTLFTNYGVIIPMQSIEIMNIHRRNNQLKYGVDYFVQTEAFRESYITTSLNNFGVDNPMKSKSIIAKLKDSHKLKYGVSNPMQREDVKSKFKITMIERYGVSHPSQVPEFLTKIQKSSYKMKEYHWKTGEISMVQGYEPIVLKELEDEGYNYSDILTNIIDMPEIIYTFEDSNHRYYPDIFIPNENLIIEVKSDYTLNKEWDKNQAKFSAVRSLGFDFRLEIR